MEKGKSIEKAKSAAEAKLEAKETQAMQDLERALAEAASRGEAAVARADALEAEAKSLKDDATTARRMLEAERMKLSNAEAAASKAEAALEEAREALAAAAREKASLEADLESAKAAAEAEDSAEMTAAVEAAIIAEREARVGGPCRGSGEVEEGDRKWKGSGEGEKGPPGDARGARECASALRRLSSRHSRRTLPRQSPKHERYARATKLASDLEAMTAELASLRVESEASVEKARKVEQLEELNAQAEKFVNGFKQNLETANKEIAEKNAEIERRTEARCSREGGA